MKIKAFRKRVTPHPLKKDCNYPLTYILYNPEVKIKRQKRFSMKNYILWLLFCTAVLLQADFNPQLYQATLPQTDGKKVVIEDRNIPVGSSGIVLHAFDDTHKTIVAEAIVTQKKENKITIKFRKFKRLRQTALPEYKISPQKGDTLILNYLYNRILPVTANEKTFKTFTKKYQSTFEIIHPDIFASQLYFEHQPQPTKEDFQNACQQNDTSLLYFTIEKSGYFVDCNSFKVLYKEPLTSAIENKNAHKPFYHRLPEIKNRLGGILSSESIGDYNLYYKKLLGIK
jgi:hypothetical protein